MVRPGYKQTEVGMIPENWHVLAIDQVAQVTSGKRLPLGCSLIDRETHHPYIRVADMKMGGIDTSNIKYVPDDVFPRIKNYTIYQDDIFISVAGSLGIVGTIPVELNGANLTENADRLTKIQCSKEYLLYVLMSSQIQNVIAAIQTIGAQPKLALTRIRKFDIPLPPTKAEQQAIAEALSDADAWIESLEKLIAKKRLIKQGAMRELLRPQNDWTEINLGKQAVLKARIGWQGLTTSEYLETGDYRLVTGTEFCDGHIAWEKCVFVEKRRYDQDRNIQLQKDDVLVTKDGTIGKVAFIDALEMPSTLNSGVFVLRPICKAFDARFLFHILNSEYFLIFLNQLSAGSTINHLYQKDFVTFSFPAPRDKLKQAEIALSLSSMDSEISALEQKLVKARAIKQGMMQELLTGRIRLI